jgi:hypothetical protein
MSQLSALPCLIKKFTQYFSLEIQVTKNHSSFLNMTVIYIQNPKVVSITLFTCQCQNIMHNTLLQIIHLISQIFMFQAPAATVQCYNVIPELYYKNILYRIVSERLNYGGNIWFQ